MSRKKRRARRRGSPPGAAPGAFTVDPEALPSVVQVMAYGPERFEEAPITDLAELDAWIAHWPVVWINVMGLGDAAVLQGLAERFGLHPLALEDVVHTHQRPKVEAYTDHYFVVARMLELAEEPYTDQLSLFFGAGFVLTFQEIPGDPFDPVRERIRQGSRRLRTAKADYLAYALLDAVVDGYFPICERYGDRLEALEEEVLAHPEPRVVQQIQRVKRDLLGVRRAIWPLRESINTLFRDTTGLVTAETQVYLRDTYDHAIQVIDLVETYREIAGGLMELYVSILGNRTNEVMRVLTIIATVFIPLSFIAGIWGMNFEPVSPWNMPELRWRYGYPLALGIMLAVALVLLYFFYRRGWLHSFREPGSEVQRRESGGEPPPRQR